jgi:hypothetical protein
MRYIKGTERGTEVQRYNIRYRRYNIRYGRYKIRYRGTEVQRRYNTQCP